MKRIADSEEKEKFDTGAMMAEALDGVARQIQRLGNGDAYCGEVEKGAIEAFGMMLKEQMDLLSSAISEAGNSIERGLGEIAEAMREGK